MALTDAEWTAAATAAVNRYAPDAPPDVRAAAVEMVTTVLPEMSAQTASFADQSVTSFPGVDAIRRSGASGLLAPWRRPRARVIEAAT